MKDTPSKTGVATLEAGQLFSVSRLRTYLEGLYDPRKARGIRYRLADVMCLLILAKLGGEDGMKGMAEGVRLREQTLLRLLHINRERLPHQTTYERLLEKLDVDALERAMGDFFAQKAPGQTLTVVLDGKVLRGTIPQGERQGVHLLAAYAPQQRVVLMQVEVGAKANEITAAPRLLEALDRRGRVVTGDAMFTQRELCDQIVLAGGDYVFPVKDNQPTLRPAIADLFMPAPVSPGHSRVRLPESCAQTYDCGQGRLEQRYLTTSSQLNDYLD